MRAYVWIWIKPLGPASLPPLKCALGRGAQHILCPFPVFVRSGRAFFGDTKHFYSGHWKTDFFHNQTRSCEGCPRGLLYWHIPQILSRKDGYGKI